MGRVLGRLCLFLPLLFGMAAASYCLDPAQLFGARAATYERGVADLLLAGRDVANAGDCDERLLQKYCAWGLIGQRDVIVVGSSRTMQVRSWMFPGRTFFNNSLSRASVGDLIAIYEVYVQRNMEPSTLVLGVDPWMLNAEFKQQRWGALDSEYEDGAERLGVSVKRPNAYRWLRSYRVYLELLSPSYFQASLRSTGAGQGYYPVGRRDVDGLEHCVRLSDGSLVYDRAKRSKTADEVRREAIEGFIPDKWDVMAGFRRLDPTLCSMLDALVAFVARRGTKVVLVLTPFHPAAYQKLMGSASRDAVLAAQDYCVSLAHQSGATIVGSYDPADLRCTDEDFLDRTHPNDACMARIVATACGPASAPAGR